MAEGVADAVGPDEALRLALGAGDDYELCVAAAPGALGQHADEFASRFGIPLTRVGSLTAGAGVFLDRGAGGPVPLAGGYSHFGAR